MTRKDVFSTKCTKLYVAHSNGEPDHVRRSKKQAGSRAREYMFLHTPLTGVPRRGLLLQGPPGPLTYEHEIGIPKSGPLKSVIAAISTPHGGA